MPMVVILMSLSLGGGHDEFARHEKKENFLFEILFLQSWLITVTQALATIIHIKCFTIM